MHPWIPALYLKGISTGDFIETLGEGPSGLSATNGYWWADGGHLNVRLDEERTCILVLIGAILNEDHVIFCTGVLTTGSPLYFWVLS